eukprot:COSAG06_NODE_39536_length_411_cov_1.173077_2_plen_71_part_01
MQKKLLKLTVRRICDPWLVCHISRSASCALTGAIVRSWQDFVVTLGFYAAALVMLVLVVRFVIEIWGDEWD